MFKKNRIFEYFIINIQILFYRLFEYKSNFYFVLAEGFFWFFLSFVIMFPIYLIFGDILNWNYVDFLFFFLIGDLIGIIGRFLFGKPIFNDLKQGNFNNYLNKPIKIFPQFYLSNMNNMVLMGLIFSFILNIVFIFIFYDNYFFSINFFFFFLLLLLFECAFLVFVQSLNFLFLGFEISKSINLFRYYYLLRIPGNIFDLFKFNFIFYIFPQYYVGVVLINLLKYNSFNLFYIKVIFFMIILFSFGAYFNWKIGLRKYSAYN